MIQIDQVRAMQTQEARVVFQLLTQPIQTAVAFQNLTVGQMDEQRPVVDFTVFQLFQLDSGNSVFAPQNQAVSLFFFACSNGRIHQAKKSFLNDRLDLIEISADRVGLHGVFRRRSQKDDLCILIKIPDLRRCTDSGLAGHKDIEKNNIKGSAFSITLSNSSGL